MRLLRNILMAVLLVSALSCGPTRHAIPVEMRHPSKSGLELAGKIITVAYSTTGDDVSDMFNMNMVRTFAGLLEKDYGTGEGSVALLPVDSNSGSYASRDSLLKILIDTGADVVFLFASPEFQRNASAAVPLKVTIHCYDGMNKADRVQSFAGSTVATLSDSDAVAAEAVETGKLLAESFVSQWKLEQYSVAYFDNQRWYEALAHAEQYDWKGAMDIWIELLDTRDIGKRAAAEFNISVACYMLGEYQLALDWLQKSKADNDMPTLTDAMLKRIRARM